MALLDRLKKAWNIFRNHDPTAPPYYGPSYGTYRPDRIRFTRGSERTIVASIKNRIAMDAAAIDIKHIRLDDNNRYMEDIDSGLNNCLYLEANVDQTGRSFRQDLFESLLDEGCIAIVPTDYDDEPIDNGSPQIISMRIGSVSDWYSYHVKVRVYNERKGEKQEVVRPKAMVGIVENPFYAVMNEPNSTMQRLVRKLSLLDIVDEQTSSGKLDLIIQLPYVIKTESRQQQAENRRKSIEKQLSEGKYGIAYTDGTERITQLNRPVENNLMKQIEYLTSMLYSQLGITEEIMNGTADEATMLNYYNRTIEPLLATVTDEMKRKFLSQYARSQKQTIAFFRDPFKLVPVNQLAEIADKFTRNAIMTSNEIRQIVGMKPSSDPDADALRNKNLPEQEEPQIDNPDVKGDVDQAIRKIDRKASAAPVRNRSAPSGTKTGNSS